MANPNGIASHQNRPATAGTNPVTQGWSQAEELFHEFMVELPRGPLAEARRRYLAFCQLHDGHERLNEAAPLVAFGFLVKAAFVDAQRKSRIFG